MEFSDVLVKIANNLRLTSEEMDFLRRMGTETQQRNSQVAGWVGSNGNANFTSPTIATPNWIGSPLGVFTVAKNDTQTLVSGVSQYVSWTPSTEVKSKYFSLDASDPTTINVTQPGFSFVIIGTVTFGSNSTGSRSLTFYIGGGGGVNLASTSDPSASGPTTLKISTILSGTYTTVKSFRMFANQSSGSDVSVGYPDTGISIFVV